MTGMGSGPFPRQAVENQPSGDFGKVQQGEPADPTQANGGNSAQAVGGTVRQATGEAAIRTLRISGKPSERQLQFFRSTARFTAYGGARGGGKSWALRRKLIALCLRYPGISCLLVRRTLPELRANHLRPLLTEYSGLLTWSEEQKCVLLPNASRIFFGYCASERDVLRYQGQEYDIIAIDEATQLSEYQFSIFKACLRGTGAFPRRMYLTCNPGGVGHAWVKRLFVDRAFRRGELPEEYRFIPARVFDNQVLTDADPEYVQSLESLPPRLRDAWLYGRWDVFEGQFFPEFDPELHTCDRSAVPDLTRRFVALDYGFDMLAALLLGVGEDGVLYVLREICIPGLTVGEAAVEVARLCHGARAEYAVASPDLWNRRQDTGRSGFEIMQACPGMPPMTAADDRRVPGWRILRECLHRPDEPSGKPRLMISRDCQELIRCLPALLFDRERTEDASGEPHSITHAPEALRYAVMSRYGPPRTTAPEEKPAFRFQKKKDPYAF